MGPYLLLLPLLLLPACSDPPAPDVIVYVVDTLRADHLPLYGHTRPTSPYLDAFATDAVVFDRALSASGWTLASVGSILTSRYPSEHGAHRDAFDPLKMNRLDPSIPSVTTVFREAGYHTAAFVNNVFLAPEFGTNRDFDLYDYDGAVGWQERKAAATVDLALQWLDANPGPSMVYIQVMEPHLPYLPLPEHAHRFTGSDPAPVKLPFAEQDVLEAWQRGLDPPTAEQLDYIQKLYDEEILGADAAFGRLVDGLRSRGRYESSVVVFTSDHGEEFFDHGRFEHGHSLLGELLRVPLVIKGLELGAPDQGRTREELKVSRGILSGLKKMGTQGRRVPEQVQLIDLAPTLLGIAGLKVPEGVHGTDLRRIVMDGSDPMGGRPALAEDCLYGPPRIAVTSGDLRFVMNIDNKVATLYRLDPYGQKDRAVEDPDEVRQLGAPLFQQMKTMRGGVEKRVGARLTAEIDGKNMERLRELGYVE